MEHSFDIDIAKRYGIQPAILLKNIYFWIEKNRANDKNFYDGYYWTYNSKKAFAELFPYMTARQIEYALQKLIDDDLIITGNYNKLAYDRTLWYAITKKGYSILQNCEMETTKNGDGIPENVEPIPNINTGSKQQIKNKDISKEFELLWKYYPRKIGKPKALKAYERARKGGTTFEEVKIGIELYCKQIVAQKTAIEYIKHGSTWFNNECWNDEYSAGVTVQKSTDLDDIF